MEHLLFSINVILPIFLVIVLGYFLKWAGIMDESFADKISTMVFKVALPVLVFQKIYQTDLSRIMGGNMKTVVLFGCSSTVLASIVIFILASVFLKDKYPAGSFTQGAYRSNYAFIGIPIMSNLFGDEGVSRLVIMLAPIMIIYNVTAVVYLTLSSKEGEKGGLGKIIKNIVTNPLIIGIVIGALFSGTGIKLPGFAEKTVTYISDIATPMALLSIGAFLDVRKTRQKIYLGLMASAIKLVIIPVVFVGISYAIGLRGIELAVLFTMYSAPTAVSSFVMAKSMNNDASLAASIIVLTTLISSITIFIGIYVLSSMQAI